MSDKIIEHTVTIKDKDGNVETTVTSSKEIPSFDDFEKLGFREAFHQLEEAVLETSEKANTLATEQYLMKGSKKNSSKRKAGLPPKAVK
jgi:hypothetical protein